MFLVTMRKLFEIVLLVIASFLSDGSSELIDGDMEVSSELGLQGITEERYKWGNHIKYHITKYSDPSKTLPEGNITEALNGIEEAVTCLTFEEFEEEFIGMHRTEMIIFQFKKKACQSQVGKQSNKPTRISMDPSVCSDVGVIQHEVIHSLGNIHEHMRVDRDSFVKVDEEKAEELNYLKDFKRWDKKLKYRLYTPYDFNSIMHYRSKYNGSTLITPHNPIYNDKITPNKTMEMSAADKLGLNLHFECPTIATSLHKDYLKFYQYSIYHELTQLDIVETEVSLKSCLLYPETVSVDLVYDDEGDSDVSGEYRKIQIGVEKPSWKHIDYDIYIRYSGDSSRWQVVRNSDGKILARSRESKKNMLVGHSTDWDNVEIDIFFQSEGCVYKQAEADTNRNTMSTSSHLKKLEMVEIEIFNHLTQFDIKETEASQRSPILFPFHIYVREQEETELFAGEYRKVVGEIRNKRPVWKHVELDYELEYSDRRWTITRTSDGATVARSQYTTKNILLTNSDQWEYLRDNQ